MRCNICVEFVDDSGARTEVEAFSLERPTLITQAELGLTHSEGKRLLFAVQQQLLRRQIAAYAAARRYCPKCGGRYVLKDYRPRVIDTLFGRVRARTPRYMNCPCTWPALKMMISPVSMLLPQRCTPELAVMRAVLGAHMPYREMARLLCVFFPDQGITTPEPSVTTPSRSANV
jgi:hypothetical protein